MDNLTIQNNKFVLSSPYNPDSLDVIRSINGRRWDPKNKVNSFPLNEDAAQAVTDMCRQFGWKIAPSALERIESLKGVADRLRNGSSASDADIDVEGFGTDELKLRPFQRGGVKYALDADCRTFIADEMGLGKTIQALAVIQAKGAYPALVICPKAVKLNWVSEAERWLPGKITKSIKGKSIPEADVLVINYDIVVKHKAALISAGFKAIVLDESHFVKNKGAKRTKAIVGYWDKDTRTRVPGIASEIPIKLALTGTAILNRPSELVAQLDYLGRLDELGGSWSFLQRYCGAKKTKFGWDMSGSSNLAELADRLRSTCYVRREKSVVATELPPLQRSMVPVALSNVKKYKQGLADVISWMHEKRAEKGVAFNRDAAYRAEALAKIEGLKQLVAMHKMTSVVDWVKNYLEGTEGGKLVLFATHRDVQKKLLEEMSDFNPAKIAGGDTDIDRAASINKFWNDPSCRVIVASLKAASVGVNLQCASAVAFAEFGWNPADHDQAEARVHRIGSEHSSINAYWLYAEGTFDDEVIALINEKRAVVDAVNRDSNLEVHNSKDVVSWFEDIFAK